MSVTLEEAIEEVRALPPEKQQQLRQLTISFGDVLLLALVLVAFDKVEKSELGKTSRLLEEFSRELPGGRVPRAAQLQRAKLAGQIRGKYRDVLTSSEEFSARKAKE